MTDPPTARWARRASLPHGSAGCPRDTPVIAYATTAQPALGSLTPVGHCQRSILAGARACAGACFRKLFFGGSASHIWWDFPKTPPAGARAPAQGWTTQRLRRDACAQRGWRGSRERGKATGHEGRHQPETVIAPRYAAVYPRGPRYPRASRVGRRTYASFGAASACAGVLWWFSPNAPLPMAALPCQAHRARTVDGAVRSPHTTAVCGTGEAVGPCVRR